MDNHNHRFVDGRIPIHGTHHCKKLLRKLFSIGYTWLGTDDDDTFKNCFPSATIMNDVKWVFIFKNGQLTYCRSLTDGARRKSKIYRFVKQPKKVIESRCNL